MESTPSSSPSSSQRSLDERIRYLEDGMKLNKSRLDTLCNEVKIVVAEINIITEWIHGSFGIELINKKSFLYKHIHDIEDVQEISESLTMLAQQLNMHRSQGTPLGIYYPQRQIPITRPPTSSPSSIIAIPISTITSSNCNSDNGNHNHSIQNHNPTYIVSHSPPPSIIRPPSPPLNSRLIRPAPLRATPTRSLMMPPSVALFHQHQHQGQSQSQTQQTQPPTASASTLTISKTKQKTKDNGSVVIVPKPAVPLAVRLVQTQSPRQSSPVPASQIIVPISTQTQQQQPYMPPKKIIRNNYQNQQLLQSQSQKQSDITHYFKPVVILEEQSQEQKAALQLLTLHNQKPAAETVTRTIVRIPTNYNDSSSRALNGDNHNQMEVVDETGVVIDVGMEDNHNHTHNPNYETEGHMKSRKRLDFEGEGDKRVSMDDNDHMDYSADEEDDDNDHSDDSIPAFNSKRSRNEVIPPQPRTSTPLTHEKPSTSQTAMTIEDEPEDEQETERSKSRKKSIKSPRRGRPKKNPEDRVRTYDPRVPMMCDECGKVLKGSGALRVHKQIHANIRPHKCNECDKAFRRKHHLEFHMMIHAGDKKETCSYCGKAFLIRRDLQRHERTHTGEKPYSCHLCSKSFNVKQHLTLHIRTHTGERPYKCLICNKTFTQANSLRIHKKIHERDGTGVGTPSSVNGTVKKISGSNNKISPNASSSGVSSASTSALETPPGLGLGLNQPSTSTSPIMRSDQIPHVGETVVVVTSHCPSPVPLNPNQAVPYHSSSSFINPGPWRLTLNPGSGTNLRSPAPTPPPPAHNASITVIRPLITHVRSSRGNDNHNGGGGGGGRNGGEEGYHHHGIRNSYHK